MPKEHAIIDLLRNRPRRSVDPYVTWGKRIYLGNFRYLVLSDCFDSNCWNAETSAMGDAFRGHEIDNYREIPESSIQERLRGYL